MDGNMRIRLGMFLAVSVAALTGCSTVHTPSLSADHRPTPAGLAGALRTSVEKLATDIGERNCYRTNNLEAAASWIEQQFRAANYNPRRLSVIVPADKPFNCGAMTTWNIEAEKRGRAHSNEVIILGAHYDTKVATPS